MATEAHVGIKLVDLHVVDTSIHAINPLQHQRNPLQLLMPWSAFENLTLDNSQVATLNGQHEAVVEDQVVHRFYAHEGLLGFAGRGRAALVED